MARPGSPAGAIGVEAFEKSLSDRQRPGFLAGVEPDHSGETVVVRNHNARAGPANRKRRTGTTLRSRATTGSTTTAEPKGAIMMPATIEAREESTHVATVQPAVKLTYEDYCAAPADKRYELLDGELIMVPAPNLKHQTVQVKLTTRLALFVA